MWTVLKLPTWFSGSPVVTKEVVEKMLEGIKGEKAAGGNEIMSHRNDEGQDTVLQKLANLFSECLGILRVPLDWKNINIVVIHKNKGLKNYRSVGLQDLQDLHSEIWAGDITALIRSKKWTWAGHVMQRTDNRWTV